jgi:hypothetical protein
MLSKFTLLFSVAATLTGADVYIRDGASGDGSSWTDALDTIPISSSLVRGNVYYFADGDYGSYTMAKAESSSQLITFKKAIDDTRCASLGMTTAECRGTGTGWTDSYGDGVAKLDWLQVERGDFVLDGQITCTDIKNCQRGFLVEVGTTLYHIAVSAPNIVNNVVFKSITVDGVVANLKRGFRFCCNGGQGVVLQDIEIKNIGNDPINLSIYSDVDINRLYIHSRLSSDDSHADAMEVVESPISGSPKNTLRNSIINWDGQQLWFTGGVGNPVNGEWDIFANVWTSPTCGTAIASVTAIKFRNDELASSAGPLNIYNNTFACLYNAFVFSDLTTGVAQNNIFYNLTTGMGGFNQITHDYNYYDTALGSTFGESNGQAGSDPFVNLSVRNFRLSFATAPGVTLSAPFNVDPLGIVRGTGGVWDRGAYEYAPTGSTSGGPRKGGGPKTKK